MKAAILWRSRAAAMASTTFAAPSPLEGATPVPDLCVPTAGVTNMGTLSVLVVEDDELQRNMLAELFQTANAKKWESVTFEVQMVANGKEALDLLASNGQLFDLILLDLMLPDIHGDELLPELRELCTTTTAIIILSAHLHVRLAPLYSFEFASQSFASHARLNCAIVLNLCSPAPPRAQMAMMKRCKMRGADALLAKPIKTTSIELIYQYVKALPQAKGTSVGHRSELLLAGPIHECDEYDEPRSKFAEDISILADKCGLLLATVDENDNLPPPRERHERQEHHGEEGLETQVTGSILSSAALTMATQQHAKRSARLSQEALERPVAANCAQQ